MSAQHELDRTLNAWFHGDATVAPPAEPLARAIESTRKVRPRMTAVAVVGSHWVDSDAGDGLGGGISALRPAVVLALTLLLALALVGGALLVGGRLFHQVPKPPPFGVAGNGVIAVEKDGDILVADRPGGELRPLVAGPEHDGGPNFSPDGTKLTFVRANEQGPPVQMLADADGTNITPIAQDPPELTYGRFTPDGRSLIGVGKIRGEWRVVIRPVDPAVPPTVLEILLDGSSMVRSQAGRPSFSPANTQELLVVGKLAPDAPRGIHIYDLATGRFRTVLEQAWDQYLSDVAWLPDGRHITYRSTTSAAEARVVASDGSDDQSFDGVRGQFSPISNDGTRIVAERGGEGAASPRPVIVRIDGEGEPVPIACGSGTDFSCPEPPDSWVWSPDDSVLIGIILDETSISGEDPLAYSYVQVDSETGEITKLDWRDVGTPAWQRVTP